MTQAPPRNLALLISLLALAACNEATSPTPPDGTVPALAVAVNSWSTRADLPGAERFFLATAGVENPAGKWTVYAIGGQPSNGGGVRTVQAYNVATNSWSYKAPAPVILYRTNGAGTIRGKVYVSGGVVGNGNVMAALYEYDPARNAWTRKRDMPKPSYQGVTGVINNKLYVVSGCEQDSCGPQIFTVLYRYDPLTNLWTTLAPPPNLHIGSLGGAINGKIYVSRGNILDVYNPATNTWTTKASTGNREQGGGAGATMAGKLYLFGGYERRPDGSMTETNSTRAYDPTTNRWTDLTPMPAGRHVYISATRVFLNGQFRMQVMGGKGPGNNLAYIP